MLFLYDSTTAARREKKLAARSADDAGKGARLLCARCGHAVTRQGERIEVDGAHEHRRTNPAGYRFHFGCFRAAPGCTTQGAATDEHTWFAGYAWRIANCASCLGQLGWRYERGADAFYGLIFERLAEEN
ncbi:MAG TPA: cereblon family protein [Burkholderiales bacterium]|nr:cereblon family protein [Burkholderiales bacterium]